MFGGAAILTAVTAFVELTKAQTRVAIASLLIVAVGLPAFIVFANYLPLLVLIHKLQSN